MAMMNKLTAAYVAGYLDGEGCFSIWYKQGNYYRKRKGRVFECVIRVGCTNRGILEWLQRSFGGSVGTMSKPGNGLHRTQAYQWALRKKGVMDEFLRVIIPYLRIKKREAQILRSFIRTFRKENYTVGPTQGGTMMTDETFRERMELLEELQSLNQKGVRRQRERLSEVTS